jgi:hypothetical protein
MKKVFYPIYFCIFSPAIYAQLALENSSYKKWSVELAFYDAPKFSGYTQVGEWEQTGDKLFLVHDLGMKHLYCPEVRIVRRFNKNSSFSFSASRFFFSGHNIINRNVFYNGALLKGTDGLSINQTNFYRVKLSFEESFHPSEEFYPTLLTGVTYDALNFYVRGTILPGYGKEDHEDFVTQSLPYPFVGFRLNRLVSLKSSVAVEASGTYIPLYKSFFYEGGQISLHYATADVGLHYWLNEKKYSLGAGYLWRLNKQYEYSNEDDPNDFFLRASGIQLNFRFNFPPKYKINRT